MNRTQAQQSTLEKLEVRNKITMYTCGTSQGLVLSAQLSAKQFRLVLCFHLAEYRQLCFGGTTLTPVFSSRAFLMPAILMIVNCTTAWSQHMPLATMRQYFRVTCKACMHIVTDIEQLARQVKIFMLTIQWHSFGSLCIFLTFCTALKCEVMSAWRSMKQCHDATASKFWKRWSATWQAVVSWSPKYKTQAPSAGMEHFKDILTASPICIENKQTNRESVHYTCTYIRSKMQVGSLVYMEFGTLWECVHSHATVESLQWTVTQYVHT